MLSSEEIVSNIVEISNLVLDVTIKSKFSMVKDITLVEKKAPIEDVPHEAGVSLHCAMGMDEVRRMTGSSGNKAWGGAQE